LIEGASAHRVSARKGLAELVPCRWMHLFAHLMPGPRGSRGLAPECWLMCAGLR